MREQSEMAAPVFSLQIYCNITTEHRLGRELRRGGRCNRSVIHEKRRKRLKKYRLSRELRRLRRCNGSAIYEK